MAPRVHHVQGNPRCIASRSSASTWSHLPDHRRQGIASAKPGAFPILQRRGGRARADVGQRSARQLQDVQAGRVRAGSSARDGHWNFGHDVSGRRDARVAWEPRESLRVADGRSRREDRLIGVRNRSVRRSRNRRKSMLERRSGAAGEALRRRLPSRPYGQVVEGRRRTRGRVMVGRIVGSVQLVPPVLSKASSRIYFGTCCAWFSNHLGE
mmetsp:Transcript_9107/g.55445  ORF Transcript_9107/g.55445 Transcript_9107/m.55445 type:complete len:211 (-) Transcript_9107:519-1151(-)